MTAARWRKGGGGSSGHDSPELFAAALCYALSRTAIAHGAGWQALRGRHDARSMSDDGWSVIVGSSDQRPSVLSLFMGCILFGQSFNGALRELAWL